MNLKVPDKIGGIPTIPLALICIVLIAAGVAFATFTNHSNSQTGLSGQQEGMSDEEIQKALENENITQPAVTNDGDTSDSEDGVTELTGTYLKKLYGYNPTTVAADPVYEVQPTTTDNPTNPPATTYTPVNPPAQPQINTDPTVQTGNQPGTIVISNNTINTTTNNTTTINNTINNTTTTNINTNNTTTTGKNLTVNDEGYYHEGEWDPFDDPIEPENPDQQYEDENDST